MTSLLLIPFLGAAARVLPGSEVMTKPDRNDAVKGCVGLPVASPVQPVPVGLAGGGRHRTYPAQLGEGSLGVNALGVTAGRDQQSRRRVGSYSEYADQGRGCHLGESFQLAPQIADLLVELPRRVEGSGRQGSEGCTWPPPWDPGDVPYGSSCNEPRGQWPSDHRGSPEVRQEP